VAVLAEGILEKIDPGLITELKTLNEMSTGIFVMQN